MIVLDAQDKYRVQEVLSSVHVIPATLWGLSNNSMMPHFPFLSPNFGSALRGVVLFYSLAFEKDIVPNLRFWFPIDLVFVARSVKSPAVVTVLFQSLRQDASTLTTPSSSGSSSGSSSYSGSSSWSTYCSWWGTLPLPLSTPCCRPFYFLLALDGIECGMYTSYRFLWRRRYAYCSSPSQKWASSLCTVLKQPERIHKHIRHSLCVPKRHSQIRFQQCLNFCTTVNELMMYFTEVLYTTDSIVSVRQKSQRTGLVVSSYLGFQGEPNTLQTEANVPRMKQIQLPNADINWIYATRTCVSFERVPLVHILNERDEVLFIKK